MKYFLKYIKSTKGQSLAEFAVVTAMMATMVLVKVLKKRKHWPLLITL